MLAIVAELVILSVLLVKQKQGLRTAIGIGVFLVVVVGLLTWVGGAELTKRIATRWIIALRAIQRHPP